MTNKPFDLTRPRYEARVPSNIAFVKYWGKRAESSQWPANDSLSMTLSDLGTVTTAQTWDGPDHVVIMNGQAWQRDDRPARKVFRHLDVLRDVAGSQQALRIETSNNFPAGAGMASSASGLGALTLSALAAWCDAGDWDEFAARGYGRETLAHWARLGSGSAGRSLFGGYVLWEAGPAPDAQRISAVHAADHWPLLDVAVVLHEGEKPVPSTDAHRAAWESPLFAPRLAVLPERMAAVRAALADRDMSRLGPLLEAEALEMHAVIMTAKSPIHYLSEDSLSFLAHWRTWRRMHGVPAYITIDAGPNMHVIAEPAWRDAVLAGIEAWRPGTRALVDQTGAGPSVRRLGPQDGRRHSQEGLP